MLASLAGLAVPALALAQDDSGNAPGAPAAPPPPVRQPDPGAVLQPGPAAPQPGGQDDPIQIDQLAEPWELRNFVDYVAGALQINIIATDQLSGSVVINAPMELPRKDLLNLLDAMLEQHGFTILRDEQGFYQVRSLDQVSLDVGGATRIIPTGGIKPTSLEAMVRAHLSGPDRPVNKLSFIDDLGVIVLTDSPRRTREVEALVAAMIAKRAEQRFLRFEVENISAAVARVRVIDLLGAPSAGAGGGMQNIQVTPEGNVIPGSPGGRLANLPDRLTVDAQGNALIFRGTESEAGEVESVLAVLDVPNNLETRVYFAGSAATAIADIARSRGLAEIQEVQSAPETGEPGMAQPGRGGIVPQPVAPVFPGQPTSQAPKGGPTMVVDTSRGIILYAGTKAQHEQVAAIIKEFDTEQDQIVVRAYQLQHADSQDVADLLLSLLLNQAPAALGSGNLLPRQERFYRGIQQGREQRTGRSSGQFGSQSGESRFGGGGGLGGLGAGGQTGIGGREQPGVGSGGGEGDTYVIADPKNNQVLVKAPAKLQPEFQALIEKVDLRRPQVYIEAQIVAVNATKEFRLAFNYQLINAGGEGGILNFQTGLGSFGEDGTITDPVGVETSLLGVTAALIRSEYVPVIITALQRNVDGRVLSSPQLLIDDNETATLVSVEQQPTTTSSQSNTTTETGFGGYEEAGTQLTITPSISQGGYVRMAYQVVLSSFVGQPTTLQDSVIPPARLQNEVSGDSVTVPGDTTVVVGGVTVDTMNDTIIKVPLLGDIPILGYLFRDTGKSKRQTTLYIFLTPRILREPSIPDLLLLTRGPQASVGLKPDVPAVEPSVIEIFAMPSMEPAPPTARPERP